MNIEIERLRQAQQEEQKKLEMEQMRREELAMAIRDRELAAQN